MVTRRELLAASTALPFATGAFGQVAPTGLNAIAQTKGMRFGSAFSWAPPGADAGSFANPAYAALLERDCGILVPENELKWQALRPDAKTFRFDRFSDMIAYAEAHGMKMRGHTLMWHKTERFPAWLNSYDFGATPAKEAERLLGQHIRTIGKYFGSRLTSVDVVNETVDDRDGSLRTSSIAKAFGGTEAMLDYAYHSAREAMPGAQLVYNDYMSWEPGNERFRDGVLRLLEGFRKRGVPIDALGLQSHIAPRGDGRQESVTSGQEKPWRDFLDHVTAMGFKLLITEFDVNDKMLTGDPVKRDREIADYSRAYLDVTLSYKQVTDMLVWGMCDKYTWLNGFDRRADGKPTRACPYDAEFKPKPLYDAFAKALAAAPPR
jgi:endo-1,4-beta-xylanase